MRTNARNIAKDVAYMGIMVALLWAGKLALSSIPNVEIVTLLFIVYTLYFGKKTYLVSIGFVALEVLQYGLSIWVVMYLYIWPLLIFLTDIFRGRSHMFFCFLSGAFGLLFGLLCSIPNVFISGLPTAVAWWIDGIPYDLIHCVSNFLVCLVAYKPLCKVAEKVFAEK